MGMKCKIEKLPSTYKTNANTMPITTAHVVPMAKLGCPVAPLTKTGRVVLVGLPGWTISVVTGVSCGFEHGTDEMMNEETTPGVEHGTETWIMEDS